MSKTTNKIEHSSEIIDDVSSGENNDTCEDDDLYAEQHPILQSVYCKIKMGENQVRFDQSCGEVIVEPNTVKGLQINTDIAYDEKDDNVTNGRIVTPVKQRKKQPKYKLLMQMDPRYWSHM